MITVPAFVINYTLRIDGMKVFTTNVDLFMNTWGLYRDQGSINGRDTIWNVAFPIKLVFYSQHFHLSWKSEIVSM